jgi:catechol 2,3-dioxygenase-like lactoylglutathione lyase family enzyme
MELIAFVPSVDLGRARGFYEGRLGLTLADETPYALVMRNGATTLRITKVEHLAPQPFTVLGWAVDDIHRAIAELGVECVRYDGLDQDEAGVWITPSGDQVAWFKDPDGNTLSLSHQDPVRDA